MYDYFQQNTFNKELVEENAQQNKIIDAEAKKVETFNIIDDMSYFNFAYSVEDDEEVEEAEQAQESEASSISKEIGDAFKVVEPNLCKSMLGEVICKCEYKNQIEFSYEKDKKIEKDIITLIIYSAMI